MPLLELRGVAARYGALQALRGIDLSVDEGEIVAVLGANGAGKTTTLRAISATVKASGFPGGPRRSPAPGSHTCPRAAGRSRSFRSTKTFGSAPTFAATGQGSRPTTTVRSSVSRSSPSAAGRPRER